MAETSNVRGLTRPYKEFPTQRQNRINLKVHIIPALPSWMVGIVSHFISIWISFVFGFEILYMTGGTNVRDSTLLDVRALGAVTLIPVSWRRNPQPITIVSTLCIDRIALTLEYLDPS